MRGRGAALAVTLAVALLCVLLTSGAAALALRQPAIERINTTTRSQLHADYSADPRGIRLSPLLPGIAAAAERDGRALDATPSAPPQIVDIARLPAATPAASATAHVTPAHTPTAQTTPTAVPPTGTPDVSTATPAAPVATPGAVTPVAGTPTFEPAPEQTPPPAPAETPAPPPTEAPPATPTFAAAPTQTAIPTASPTRTPIVVPTQSPTRTATSTPPNTVTNTPFPTPSATSIPSSTPTFTATPALPATNTPAPTPTDTPTPTPTATATPAPAATNTPAPTPTDTSTPTPAITPTATPTSTPTPSPTPSPSPTTSIATPTPASTGTPAPTASTGLLSCSSNAPVILLSGDGDGYERNPSDACVPDGNFAQDKNSGTQDNTTCSDLNADRHTFSGYGIALPAAATVDGITVRLDATANGSNDNPRICVELSWDNGLTWTLPQTTGVLGNAQTTFLLGGPTDTWGRTWSLAQLLNATFVVRVTDIADKKDKTFSLDWIAVNVTYTP